MPALPAPSAAHGTADDPAAPGRTLATEEGAAVAIAWIAVGVVLIGVELLHFAFYALFAAVGCLAAAAVAVVAPDAIALQVLAGVLVAALGIILVRPRVSEALVARRGGHRTRGVHGGFVGHEVVTLDVVGGHGRVGHVELAGERWLAVSGSDVALPPGTRVVITGVEGTTLIVWPVEGLIATDDGPLVGDGDQEQSS
jgi:membrane protein implicated in regulation of membrane protease activity